MSMQGREIRGQTPNSTELVLDWKARHAESGVCPQISLLFSRNLRK
jgi:hypothetical protein